MKKIAKIWITINGGEKGKIQKVLLPIFSPFGSLTEGVNGETLSDLMIRWVGGWGGGIEVIDQITKILWSTTTDHVSSLIVGRPSGSIGLITPTSGTTITLYSQQYTSNHDVVVTFGDGGSKCRAMHMILELHAMEGIDLRVYCRGGGECLSKGDLEVLIEAGHPDNIKWEDEH